MELPVKASSFITELYAHQGTAVLPYHVLHKEYCKVWEQDGRTNCYDSLKDMVR